MPMMERRKEADSLSAPLSTALAARYMKGTKKPKKVMKLEKQKTLKVSDLKRENWIMEDRARTKADLGFFPGWPSISSAAAGS